MQFIKLYIFTGFTLLMLKASAQSVSPDSIYHLEEVIITESRLDNFAPGTKVQIIDSASLKLKEQENLADLLSEVSPLFIKSYGLGSLATSSFRGGSAYHTAVLWNGFNLNSPANGQLDLALIPNLLAGRVSIQYGGSSALWGSGAVGGAILLDNDLQFNNGELVEIGANIGSFGQFAKDIHLEISKRKFISSIKLYQVNADNDFEFIDPTKIGNPTRKQMHAEIKKFGLITENALRLSENQKINFRVWYQNADRNIPPILLQSSSTSNQKDESYRLSSEWQMLKKRTIYQVRVGYFDEYLDYNDQNIIEAGKSSSQSLIAEAEIKKNLGKGYMINLGLNNTYINGQAANYMDNVSENRSALFLSFTSQTSKFKTTLSAREEFIDPQFAPLAFSLGSQYQSNSWISIKASFSKVYRLPTFNERFWVPGGNINILPETGFTEDLGLLLKPEIRNKTLGFSLDLSLFNRNIENWIIWLPGSGFWSPQNLSKVWSRGFETNTAINYKLNKVNIKASVLTNYTRSTNELVKIEGDASLHKQLIYVPEFSGNGRISFEYNSFLLLYSQNYTGYRYTSTDNEEFLPSYWTANVSAQYELKKGSYSFIITGKIYNIYNESYQVLLNRPMPLINYQLGIRIGFHHKNSTIKNLN